MCTAQMLGSIWLKAMRTPAIHHAGHRTVVSIVTKFLFHQCCKRMYMCPSGKINLKDIRKEENLDLAKLTFLYLPHSKT